MQAYSNTISDSIVKLSAHPVKTGQARQGLPGNEDMIIGSALTPLRESVAACSGSIQLTCPRGKLIQKNPDPDV